MATVPARAARRQHAAVGLDAGGRAAADGDVEALGRSAAGAELLPHPGALRGADGAGDGRGAEVAHGGDGGRAAQLDRQLVAQPLDQDAVGRRRR